MALKLWGLLKLSDFWTERLPASRQGTRWLNVLITLVIYRLIDPGSEWRLHRHWYERSAVGDLLGEDFALAAKDNLYRCLDKLLEHREELFKFLQARWRDDFGAKFDVLLHDLRGFVWTGCWANMAYRWIAQPGDWNLKGGWKRGGLRIQTKRL